MKRINNSSEITAFGQNVSAEQIKRSRVLRRLAEGPPIQASTIASLLPEDQFTAWFHFTKAQILPAEKLAAVLEAATALEDSDTVDAAARMHALIVRGSFRKDIPGTPLERLRSVPNSEPSLPLPDGCSASPSLLPPGSDFPASTTATSSGNETAAETLRGGSHLSGSSLVPSIAGSRVDSNSTPIADTRRLMSAAGSSSGSAVLSFSASPAPALSAGFRSNAAQRSMRSTSPPQHITPFAHTSATPSSSAAPAKSSAGGAQEPSSNEPSHTMAPQRDAGLDTLEGATPAEQPAFPPRSVMAALCALSPGPLEAILRHLHLTITLHLPPRFRTVALQCRATRAPDNGGATPLTALDLSGTLTSPCSRTGSAHPIISTYILDLPSCLPNLQHLSLANNHLRAVDAAVLRAALFVLPQLASLDLSDNPELTAGAVTSLICGCRNLKTGLTRLGLSGCSRSDPMALAGVLNFLENLSSLSFGPAPPRIGDVPLLQPIADPLRRLTSLKSLRLSGFGSATLTLIPHLPFETLTTLDVSSAEDVVAPMHAALADQAPRMRAMRQLHFLGWSCTTVDAGSIDRFMAAISELPRLESLTMSGAPPHNPDLTPITQLTTLTSIRLKHLSRHLFVPLMRHLPLLRDYCCIKCHTPPAQVYKSVVQSGAAIFSAMRTVELVDCDMDENARRVTFSHLCGMSHLQALILTFPTGGNLTNFPCISEVQIFLPMIRGLTRLELSCCYRFLPDDPPAVLDFSAQAALQRLRVTVTERSAAPMPSSFETSCFRGLGALTDLRSLDFSHTVLADIPSFVGELAPLTRLTALCLVDTAPRGCAFAAGWSGGDMAARLATALEPLSALERLELSFVPLGDEGAAMLAPALGHLHGLQHLGLLKTGVTDVGAAALWSHVRALPLNDKVLINSASTLPYGDAGTDSMQSGSIAIAQGHPGFPYPMI